VNEVIAFAETVQKPQEKSMLLSLVIGRWAEFDPAGRDRLRAEYSARTSRNWAITSAVSGWAERDSAAATAWRSKLPPGPARDQALQNNRPPRSPRRTTGRPRVSRDAPAGRNRQSLYWPIFSKWTRPILLPPRIVRISCRLAKAAMQRFRSSAQLGKSGSRSRVLVGEHTAARPGPKQRAAKYPGELGEAKIRNARQRS
jgi:hypothetical protein